MSNQLPTSPLSELAQGAVAAHEMFRAYIEAGFTETQALHLVQAILVAAIRANTENRPDS